MINKDDYGWFVRVAYHAISIRTLNHDKVKIFHNQVVFHQKKYLGKMPGFSPVIGFNPQDPAQRALIRVGPPPEFQSIEISNFISDAELNAPEVEDVQEDEPVQYTTTEIPATQEYGLTEPISEPKQIVVREEAPVSFDPIAEDDVLSNVDDIKLSQVLAKARQLVEQENAAKEAAAAKAQADEEAAEAEKAARDAQAKAQAEAAAKAQADAAAKARAQKAAQEAIARKQADEKRARQEEQAKKAAAAIAEKKAKMREEQERARQQIQANSEVKEEIKTVPVNTALNTIKEELSTYDNRKWYALTKKEACKFLDDAGIDHSHIEDTKWDKVNHLKEQVQGK